MPPLAGPRLLLPTNEASQDTPLVFIYRNMPYIIMPLCQGFFCHCFTSLTTHSPCHNVYYCGPSVYSLAFNALRDVPIDNVLVYGMSITTSRRLKSLRVPQFYSELK